jgi:hypothetical protein
VDQRDAPIFLAANTGSFPLPFLGPSDVDGDGQLELVLGEKLDDDSHAYRFLPPSVVVASGARPADAPWSVTSPGDNLTGGDARHDLDGDGLSDLFVLDDETDCGNTDGCVRVVTGDQILAGGVVALADSTVAFPGGDGGDEGEVAWSPSVMQGLLEPDRAAVVFPVYDRDQRSVQMRLADPDHWFSGEGSIAEAQVTLTFPDQDIAPDDVPQTGFDADGDDRDDLLWRSHLDQADSYFTIVAVRLVLATTLPTSGSLDVGADVTVEADNGEGFGNGPVWSPGPVDIDGDGRDDLLMSSVGLTRIWLTGR